MQCEWGYWWRIIDTSIGQQSFSPTSWLESRVEGKRRWCMVADAPEVNGSTGAHCLHGPCSWLQSYLSGWRAIRAPCGCEAICIRVVTIWWLHRQRAGCSLWSMAERAIAGMLVARAIRSTYPVCNWCIRLSRHHVLRLPIGRCFVDLQTVLLFSLVVRRACTVERPAPRGGIETSRCA